MKQTWRWFGPADSISIDDLLQVGVEGVVSALHHIPNGAIWPVEEIKKRQAQIGVRLDGSESGLAWEIVESLPVSENIKTQTGEWRRHIDAYKQSLRNLSECGIEVVCYNFMPVLDWTRTDLRAPQPHGGTAMRFDLVDFAMFDVHILGRDDASSDYSDAIIMAANARFVELSDHKKIELKNNIVAGLPGANDSWDLDDIQELLEVYSAISDEQLRANLVAFLEEVIPTCEELGIRLCCHPDDPPFSILGLPRIMSSLEDYKAIMNAVESPNNGITLCTGSLGVADTMDFEKFIAKLGDRIHFVHLRNTTREEARSGNKISFFEAPHLDGDTDMVKVIRALLDEEKARQVSGRKDHNIPIRPDHGQEILDDMSSNSMPGYPLVGRMRGLAELRGIMRALAS